MKAQTRTVLSQTTKDRNTSAIVYDGYERKNILESDMLATLTPLESLIRALDLIDFMVAFQNTKVTRDDNAEEIDWIVLELTKK